MKLSRVTARNKLSSLAEGNKTLREKQYEVAMAHYQKALENTPSLRQTINFNLALARKKCKRKNDSADIALLRNQNLQRFTISAEGTDLELGEETSHLDPEVLAGYIEQLELAYANQLTLEHNATAIQKNLISRNAEIRFLKLRLSEMKTNRAALYECALKLFKLNYGPYAIGTDEQRKWGKNIISQLRESRLIDIDWYLENNSDVAISGLDAVEHFVFYGVTEGRNPNAFFDTAWYLSTYQDVAEAGINPLIHYFSEGWKISYDPSPRFSTERYLSDNPGITSADVNPLLHYLENVPAHEREELPSIEMAIEPISNFDPGILGVPSKTNYGAREFETNGPGKLFREFTPANKYTELNRFHGLSPEHLAPSEESDRSTLRLTPLMPKCFMEIPGQAYPPNNLLCIEIELTCSESGQLTLQYITKNDQRFNNEKCQTRNIEIGENTVTFQLGTTHLIGGFRLVFEKLVNPIFFKSIKINIYEKIYFGAPKLSFIIPCFNHGKFVTETVESIRQIRDRDQFEIIIIDDGSTKIDCIDTLDELSTHSDIKLIRQKNQGLGAARNNGINQSRGRYILPVDADNKIRPTYFYRSIEMFETDPEIGVVFSDVQFFGVKNFRRSLPRHHFSQQFVQNKIDACAVFRREVWEQVGGYQEQMIGYQDWEFWAAVSSLENWKFYHLREIGFDYRVLPGSMVTHTRRFHEEILDFISARHVRNLRKSHADLKKQIMDATPKSPELGAPVILTSKTEPLVSIIAPNFNKQHYLRTRLDSIFKQTYRNFEVILLDDASTDDSKSILKSYSKRFKNVKLVFNAVNSGNVFKQWKNGIARAKGDFIWIAECDDYCDAHFLSKLVPHLSSPFNVGVAYCQSNFVDEDGHIFDNHLRVLKGLDRTIWNNDFLMEGSEFIKRYMRRMNCLPNASGVLFRRDLADLIDWDEVTSYAVCGDWWVWVKFLTHTNLYFCSTPMNFFRFNQSTVRSKKGFDLSRISEHLRILKVIEDIVGLSEEQKLDALVGFKSKLQHHLDNNGAQEDQLLSLLSDLYKMAGSVSVRLSVLSEATE